MNPVPTMSPMKPPLCSLQRPVTHPGAMTCVVGLQLALKEGSWDDDVTEKAVEAHLDTLCEINDDCNDAVFVDALENACECLKVMAQTVGPKNSWPVIATAMRGMYSALKKYKQAMDSDDNTEPELLLERVDDVDDKRAQQEPVDDVDDKRAQQEPAQQVPAQQEPAQQEPVQHEPVEQEPVQQVPMEQEPVEGPTSGSSDSSNSSDSDSDGSSGSSDSDSDGSTSGSSGSDSDSSDSDGLATQRQRQRSPGSDSDGSTIATAQR